MADRLQQIFHENYRQLRPRAPIPEIKIEFFPFANLNNTIRMRDGRLRVRLSDLLEGAPDAVLHAIAHILLAKMYRKEIDRQYTVRYRRHVSSKVMREKSHLLRQLRGRKTVSSAQGRNYNLETIFENLNSRFFYGLLARPIMTWSRGRARHCLGHYDPAHNAIVVSRIFNRPEVPRSAVEYIVYHEMLHLKHPVRLRGSRRCVHSAAFQAEEKLFPELEAARLFLQQL